MEVTMKSRSYIGFGFAAIIALIAVTAFMADQHHTASAADHGALSLSVPGGDCAGTTCTVDQGAAFTLEAQIDTAPAAGYILIQSWIDFGSDLVYKPTDDPNGADELVWDDNGCTVAVRATFEPTAVGHGCTTGIIPPLPVSSFEGTLVSLAFNCSEGESSTEVQLLPTGAPVALTNGTEFKTQDNDSIVPELTNVTINCGAGDGSPEPTDETPEPTDETPEPTDVTPEPTDVTPEPTDTPRPDDLCGDLNKDGSVDSRDSLWVLWFTAGLVSDLDNDGDVNGDGSVTAVDASLILQAEAALIDNPCV